MKEVAIGIDIGGTNTAYGVIDRQGNCLTKKSIPTNTASGMDEYYNVLHNAIENTLKEIPETTDIKGIGIGVPNKNFYEIIDVFQKFYKFPMFLIDDANAAAMGEMIYGNAKKMRDFIMITLGTGLGSGIVVNGELVYGHDGYAGEIGHTIYDPNGRECNCGRKGCLETYCSATGIKRTVFELLANKTEASVLRRISYNEMTAKMISDAAMKGDEIALEAFEITGKILGMKLADAVAHTSPEAIFLFGGLEKAGELLYNPTRKYMEEYMLSIYKNKVKLLPSGLDDDNAAILGTSALVWKHCKN